MKEVTIHHLCVADYVQETQDRCLSMKDLVCPGKMLPEGSGFATVKSLPHYNKDTIAVIAHGLQHFLTAMPTADGLN